MPVRAPLVKSIAAVLYQNLSCSNEMVKDVRTLLDQLDAATIKVNRNSKTGFHVLIIFKRVPFSDEDLEEVKFN